MRAQLFKARTNFSGRKKTQISGAPQVASNWRVLGTGNMPGFGINRLDLAAIAFANTHIKNMDVWIAAQSIHREFAHNHLLARQLCNKVFAWDGGHIGL